MKSSTGTGRNWLRLSVICVSAGMLGLGVGPRGTVAVGEGEGLVHLGETQPAKDKTYYSPPVPAPWGGWGAWGGNAGARSGGDTCASATAIGSLPYNDTGNTCGFVNDYDEVCPNSGSISPDVVYSYTPASDNVIDISLCNGSTYDTKLYVYAGSCPGTLVACSDDSCPGWLSELTNVPMTAGTTYYIIVDGFDDNCGVYYIDVEEACVTDCDAGSTPEGEPSGGCATGYTDDYNSGCNHAPPVYNGPLLAIGDTFCGETGTFVGPEGTTRDTDWWQFINDNNKPVIVNLCATSSTELMVALIDDGAGNNCGGMTFEYEIGGGCVNDVPTEICVSLLMAPGTYTAYISPSVYDGVGCGVTYNANLTSTCLVEAGVDNWRTGDACDGSTNVAFDSTEVPTIPADFFCPGSEPFDGTINLKGPSESSDTFVERLEGMVLSEAGDQDTIDVELTDLSLVSCAPFQVQGGACAGDWELAVTLSPSLSPPPGSLTADLDETDSGTFTSALNVQPMFTFTEVANPGNQVTFDTGDPNGDGDPADALPALQMGAVDPVPFLLEQPGRQCGLTFSAGCKLDLTGVPCGNIVCHAASGAAFSHCVYPECPLCTGACCDGTTGICTEMLVEAGCQGDQQQWFKNTDCADVPCEEHEGACCDHAIGTCIGWMPESACMAIPPPGQPEFFKDTTCAVVEILGLCWEHEGACCDHDTGTCMGWMPESVCMALPAPAEPEFFKDIPCSDPGFDCWEHEGACCDHAAGACLGLMTESECLALPPPAQPEFFQDLPCSDPGVDCWEHEGACCDHATATCLGWMTESACMAIPLPGQPEFFKELTCADVDGMNLCWEHEGACCDHDTGMCLGWMTESACMALPSPAEPEFFKDITCSDPEFDCWEHEGACCDHAAGACLGLMTESECLALPPPAQPEFFQDLPCSDPGVDCWEHEGACCDHATATCLGWMTESACMAIPPPAQPEFFKDTTCSDPGFDCWEHTGACCDHYYGICYDDRTESWCMAIPPPAQPEFFKDAACANVDCDQHIGACCYERRGRWTCRVTDRPACAALPQGWFMGDDTECPKGMKAKHTGVEITLNSRPCKACSPGGDSGGPCVEGNPIDPFSTDPEENTCHRFAIGGKPPIPADFFGPGSDPFDGQVCLENDPLGPLVLPGYDGNPFDFGDADTLIRRSDDPFDRCDLPSAAAVTVDTEVVALSLKSNAPITVTFNGGQNPQQWDVTVDLSEVTPPPGSITAVKTHCNGGTYVSVLHIQPRFTFTEVGNPGNVQVLDTGLAGIDYVTLIQPDPDTPQEPDPLWLHDLPEGEEWGSPICTDFHPSIEDPVPTTACDCNCNGARDDCDIEQGAPDVNGNGVPDECEGLCDDDAGCCDDGDECTTHECQNPPSGTCVTTFICDTACRNCFDCNDSDVCTKEDCSMGTCEGPCQILFGDANDNGVVNTADVLACNGAIQGGLCAMPACDVNPTCTGNSVLNTADVLTINGAIGEPDPCNCPSRNCP